MTLPFMSMTWQRGIDAQAGAGVVDDRRRPGGIERRLRDLVERRRLAEIRIDAAIDEGIVARHGLFEIARGGIGTRWYFITIFAASSASRLALKKKPAAISTCGGCGCQPSRSTASASKIAQIGPPPLWPSPMPASAALRQLFGLYLMFFALR